MQLKVGPPQGADGAALNTGRQVHKASWRDYVCCCLPRRRPAQDAQEGDSLLAAGIGSHPKNSSSRNVELPPRPGR